MHNSTRTCCHTPPLLSAHRSNCFLQPSLHWVPPFHPSEDRSHFLVVIPKESIFQGAPEIPPSGVLWATPDFILWSRRVSTLQALGSIFPVLKNFYTWTAAVAPSSCIAVLFAAACGVRTQDSFQICTPGFYAFLYSAIYMGFYNSENIYCNEYILKEDYM